MSTGSTTITTIFDSFCATATAASLYSFEPLNKGFNAYSILRDLVTTLQSNHVPGPLLLRTSTEFTDELGKGGYAIVLGANANTIERDHDAIKNKIPRRLAVSAEAIAVKQHRSRGKAPANEAQAREFLGKHFKDAMREIVALTHASLRDHPNIVKLLGWGLCLDALEDESLEKVNIPLLVLEKAEGDLLKVLQDDKGSSRPRVSLSDRFKICADIGRGLQALHGIGLSHGDLKPNNVLIFQNTTGFTAKLCDFGTANGPMASFGKHSSYRGTERWRAPEVLPGYPIPPEGSPGLARCDIYTYGLVVWAIFTNDGYSLVDDESCPTILAYAEHDLQQRLYCPSWKKRKIYRSVLEAVRESLPFDPLFRSEQPWQHFITPVERIVNIATGALRSSFEMLQSSPELETQELVYVKAKIRRRRLGGFGNLSLLVPGVVFRPVSAPRSLTARTKIDAYAAFAEAIGFEDLVSTGTVDNAFVDSGHIDPYEHKASCCLAAPWLERLAQHVCDLLSSKSLPKSSVGKGQGTIVLPNGQLGDISNEELLYCFARFRSRLKLCCWHKLASSYFNYVSYYVSHPEYSNFSTLAWLCRGEVGRSEVQNLALRTSFIHFNTYLCSSKLDESRRLEHYLLLMESGLPPETPLAPRISDSYRKQGSSLLRFSMSFRDASIRTVMEILCERFQQAQHISDSTKSFMLCIPAHSNCKSNTGTRAVAAQKNQAEHYCIGTSALHEFADTLNYDAVEELVRMGANTNIPAREFNHKTPSEVAQEAHVSTRNQRLSQQRIISLLASNEKSSVKSSYKSSNKASPVRRLLPPGWLQRSVYEISPYSPMYTIIGSIVLSIRRLPCCMGITDVEKSQVAKDIVFFEEFTGSLTWKRPTFSLLSGGRVALGYRKLQDCYLDLISFLTPPRSSITTKDLKDRFPLINDVWYMKEPFSEIRVDNPLSQLTEAWTNSFTDIGMGRASSISGVLSVLVIMSLGIVFGLFLCTRGFTR